jgi:thiol-disulfide isomerase/thioredoxin
MIRVLIAVLALVAWGASRAAGTPPAAPPAAPKLEVTTLDKAKFDLAAQRGKWVVVNFWATWCGPCLKEMPDLSQLDRARDDLVVIGLAFEEIEADELARFVAAHPVDYAIALVDVYAPPADFPVPRGLPTTYLVDPDGHVAEHFLGPVTGKQIEQAIATHAKPAH